MFPRRTRLFHLQLIEGLLEPIPGRTEYSFHLSLAHVGEPGAKDHNDIGSLWCRERTFSKGFAQQTFDAVPPCSGADLPRGDEPEPRRTFRPAAPMYKHDKRLSLNPKGAGLSLTKLTGIVEPSLGSKTSTRAA